MLSVSLIVWGLALFDLTVLPRISTQFLGTLPPKRVADVRVAPDSLILTSTDPAGPAELWILSPGANGTRVVGVPLPRAHGRHGARRRNLTPRVRVTLRDVAGTPVDIEDWSRTGAALFAVSSPRRSPTLRVTSLGTRRPLLKTAVPLPPQKTDRRSFFVDRWSGPLPDLFVVDRDANRRHPPSSRRWSIRVYTGESNFKRLAFQTSVKKQFSKQLSQRDWWIDVGTRRQPEPSLVLVTKGGRTGTDQVEVHILSGHSKFRRFTLHTGTAFPIHSKRDRRFVFQSGRRGGAVFMAQVVDRHLRLVPLPLP